MIRDPQFAGQTKEKTQLRARPLRWSRPTRATAMALWLNQHPDAGENIAQFAINNAQERLKAAQKRDAQARGGNGPALPGKLADCSSARIRPVPSCSWSKVIRPAARRKQARDKALSRPSCPCAARY